MPLSDKTWLSFYNQLILLHCIYYFVKCKNQNPCENVTAMLWNNCIQKTQTRQKRKNTLGSYSSRAANTMICYSLPKKDKGTFHKTPYG